MLDAAVGQATAAWAAVGIAPDRLATLGAFDVEMAALPGMTLGITSSSTNKIWLDVDGGGLGWSLDGERGGVDLLSAVAHELGHALGYDHDVLSETLAPGERRLPGDHPHDQYGHDPTDQLKSLLPRTLASTDAVFERLGSARHGLLASTAFQTLLMPKTPDQRRGDVPAIVKRSPAGARAFESPPTGRIDQDTDRTALGHDILFDALGKDVHQRGLMTNDN